MIAIISLQLYRNELTYNNIFRLRVGNLAVGEKSLNVILFASSVLIVCMSFQGERVGCGNRYLQVTVKSHSTCIHATFSQCSVNTRYFLLPTVMWITILPFMPHHTIGGCSQTICLLRRNQQHTDITDLPCE